LIEAFARLDRRSKLVGASGEYKIGLRKAIDAMGPDCDAGLSPTQAEVRVVIYRFRKLADFVYKIESGLKVFKFVLLLQVAIIDHFPVVTKLLMKAL
jgi:hypothetical protein